MKDILSLLKHLKQSLNMCYEALIQEMSKKRKSCPRLYLLRDNDMLELLCCGNNLNHISQTINRIFNGLTGLKVTKSAEKSVIGCYGMYSEYLNLLSPIKFNGVVEDLLLILESSIQEALRTALEASLNGDVYEALTEKMLRDENNLDTPKTKPKSDFKALETISETSVTDDAKFMIASWILKNVNQIIEITLKIILTRQIDESLAQKQRDSLSSVKLKIEKTIEVFMVQLTNHRKNKDKANPPLSPNKSIVLIKQSQSKKIESIILILLYYRDLVDNILTHALGSESFEWLSQFRYGFVANEVDIKCLGGVFRYGFDYVFKNSVSTLLVYSTKQQYTMSQIMTSISNRSNPLIHGSNAEETYRMFCQLVACNNDFFVCTENMHKDIVFNICKAVVLSECWVTLINIQNLSIDTVNILASTIGQLNGSNDKVTINKESYTRKSINKFVPIFASIQDDHEDLAQTQSPSLFKLNKLKNSFIQIPREFFDKFKIIKILKPDYKSILNSMLIVNGFSSHELLAVDLYEILKIFASLLKKFELKSHDANMVDHSIVLLAVRNAGEDLYYKTIGIDLVDTSELIALQYPIEKKVLGINIIKTLFAQLDVNSAKILYSCIKTVWPETELQYNQQILFDDEPLQALPIFIEKETTIAVEDRPVLNDVNDAVLISSKKLNLTASVLFNSTVLDILEHLKDMKSILLLGNSSTGKTSSLKVAVNALQELKQQVNFKHLYINSMNLDDVFGTTSSTDTVLKLSKDGMLPNIIKDFQNKNKINILNIVGECTPQKAYLFESLFNDSLMFYGPNNEKITRDLLSFRLIWETDEISHLSPQLLTKSYIIYYTQPLMTTQSYFESNFQIDSDSPIISEIRKKSLEYIGAFEQELSANSKLFENAIPIGFLSQIQFMITVLISLIKNNQNLVEEDVLPIVEYSAVTGFTASLDEKSRLFFNEWWKSKSNVYPTDGTVFDYFYDIHDHQFGHWSDAIPTFSYPAHQGIPANAFVHTTTTISINNILDLVMNAEKSLMIVGSTGCGKTSLIMEKLHASCSGDITDVFYITINTNRMTDSAYIHKRINKNLIWKHSSLFVPKGNKKLYCFIDDIHLAKTDEMNRQTAVEVVRQHLDSGYFYDTANQRWQLIKNVTYITTYNPKIYSPSKSISNKILKHFHVYYQSRPSDVEIEGIYSKLMHKHIFGDEIEAAQKTRSVQTDVVDQMKSTLTSVILSSIDLNNRMESIYLKTSNRSHYVFSMHTLTSLFRHICVSLKLNFSNKELISLWHHECDWIYGKRMVDHVDYERYQLVFEAVVKKSLSEQIDMHIFAETMCFSNLYETESGIVLAGNQTLNTTSSVREALTDLYEPIESWKSVEKLLLNSLVEYNKEQQQIQFPFYENTIALICRLCHTIPVMGGHCCIMADGGLMNFTINLVASLLGYNIVNFKSSQILNKKNNPIVQLKAKLMSSCHRAGIRCEKLLLCFTEEEIIQPDFINYLTDFMVSEDIKHLFEEEETIILNSIRTQVVQTGVTFSKETAWELFVKNIRENIRIIVILNDDRNRSQWFRYEYPSFFNNLILIWIQQWNTKELVTNSLYHLEKFVWMSSTLKENVAHLLASMHLSIREHQPQVLAQSNNISFTKFVEKFVEFLQLKYDSIESSHKNVCRMLEHIQKQHNIAKKLMLQLAQENKVLEERIKSTAKMLQQIGQDMTMTEQQLKVHKIQTRKTVQLKKILPEYQTAHERNVFKTVAVVSHTKALIQNINMQSLQELRSLQKPDLKIEEVLAAIIIILKSSNADLTWQKGAKRQMANLDRFLEELQMFDEHELSEATIKLLEEMVAKIDITEMKDENNPQYPYLSALYTLFKWINGVIKYNNLMLKRVKPLHAKVKQIDEEVREADSKLASLNRKSEALQTRLKDLAQNFEEATVDKKEQEERVSKMKSQLKTASELNQVCFFFGFCYENQGFVFYHFQTSRSFNKNTSVTCRYTNRLRKGFFACQPAAHSQLVSSPTWDLMSSRSDAVCSLITG